MNDDETPLAGAFSWRAVRTIIMTALVIIACLVALTVAFNWAFELSLIPGAHAETASWYGQESGRRTANGERFTGRDMTCAHRHYPFNTRLRVTDLATGRSVVCRVNDRGPAAWTHRDIDLSRRAARRLGIIPRGTARVRIQPLP